MERWRSNNLQDETVAAMRRIGRSASVQEICHANGATTGHTPQLKTVVRGLSSGPFRTSAKEWTFDPKQFAEVGG